MEPLACEPQWLQCWLATVMTKLDRSLHAENQELSSRRFRMIVLLQCVEGESAVLQQILAILWSEIHEIWACAGAFRSRVDVECGNLYHVGRLRGAGVHTGYTVAQVRVGSAFACCKRGEFIRQVVTAVLP